MIVRESWIKAPPMSVTIDHESLASETLGFETLGQVLLHAQREDRLVVNLLIDGEQPDLSEMSSLRKFPLLGKTVYIETAKPAEMALDVLDDLQAQLIESEQNKSKAADLLQHNQLPAAMEQLGIYFSTWQAAQEAVVRTSQLLKLDLESLHVDSESVSQILEEFSATLRQTRQTLVDRDYVALTDQLLYETDATCDRWISVLDAIRPVAA